MTHLQQKILSELLIKEARETNLQYRTAHLIGIAHDHALDCTFQLIEIYNQKNGTNHNINNFLP